MICVVWEGSGGRVIFRAFYFLFPSRRNCEVTVLVVCKFFIIRVRDTLILLSVDFAALLKCQCMEAVFLNSRRHVTFSSISIALNLYLCM